MKISLYFSKFIYDCEISVVCENMTRNYFVEMNDIGDEDHTMLEIEVDNSDFQLIVTPKIANFGASVSQMDVHDWKDKLAQKVGEALFSMLDKTILRIGCVYDVSDVRENDTLFIWQQEYVFTTWDVCDILELFPVCYAFAEVMHNGKLCSCIDAFGTNRKEVLKLVRLFTLADFGWHLIFTYPLQVSRVKRLSRNRKVKRTLLKFNKLSEEKRQKVLEKMDEFMS